MTEDPKVNREVITGADVPYVKVLDGSVRVQVQRGTGQEHAVQALRQLADQLNQMSANDWQSEVGE